MRLGRNHGGYRGEPIDIAGVVRDLLEVARQHQWVIENLTPDLTIPVVALRRQTSGPEPRRRVYFSAGIHGDEPAGPLAVQQLLRDNRWPDEVAVHLCPCLNPMGFPLNRRENAQGIDLNRDYRHCRSLEVRAHVDWLARQPAFDLAVCLHEDWEAHGFYLYELNPGGVPSPAQRVLAAVAEVCPIDQSPQIDGREARGGLIRPSLDPAIRSHWPEAFYLIQHQTRHSLTLEAPSDFPLSTRVAALRRAVEALLSQPL